MQPIKQEEVFELKDLLRDVLIPDDRVQTLFHQILPDSRDFDVTAGHSVFFSCLDFLAKKRHSPPDHAPFLEFLERCRDLIADKLSQPELDTFNGWTARVSNRLEIDLQVLRKRVQSTPSKKKMNLAESPVVLVKIAPKKLVSETEFTVTVWCRHSGKYDPAGIAPRTVRRNQLGAELQSIIRRVAPRYFKQTLRLEAILPIALLDWNAHRVELPDGPYKEGLGALFPIKIRSWERTYHPDYDNSRSNWLTKWNRGPRDLLSADNIRCLFRDDVDGKNLSNELKLDEKSWVLLTLFPPPKDPTRIGDIFGAPLVAGLPFVFWPLVEELDFLTLHKELKSWLLEHSSDEWPDLLCRERKSRARSHWNDFLMLWDDPEHLPPDVKYRQSAPGQ